MRKRSGRRGVVVVVAVVGGGSHSDFVETCRLAPVETKGKASGGFAWEFWAVGPDQHSHSARRT